MLRPGVPLGMMIIEAALCGGLSGITGTTGIPRRFIIARIECDYRAQATAGDRLIVRLAVAAVGNSSFTFEYEIVNGRTREIVATARSVQVMYDYAANRPVNSWRTCDSSV